MYIYLVQNNINKKMYVGLTTNTIEQRWKLHCRHGNLLYRAIKKYGKENFTITKIAEASSLEKLGKYENILIKKLNTMSPNGYNLRDGGYSGCSPSQETRQKLREFNLGKPTGRHVDYTGKQIGELTVLSVIEGVTGINYKTWTVQCSCGKIETRTSSALRKKQFHACTECIKLYYSKLWAKDCIGQKFGKLTVLEKVKSTNKKATFLCRCDCGKEIITLGQMLRNGAKTRCSRQCSIKLKYKWNKRKINE